MALVSLVRLSTNVEMGLRSAVPQIWFACCFMRFAI